MRKASEFAVQLIAKQSLKFCHNITEKQLRNYFKKALQSKGDTGQNLIGLLNSRLDIVMFQANFSNSIYAASQLISHGNVLVNGKSVNIRSYLLKASDVISLSNKAMSFDIIDLSIQKKERVVPEYLVTDTTAKTIKFNRVPMVNEVPYAFKPEPHLVVEYYSR